MLLEDILLEEDATVENAVEKLESIRCKIVYIVNGRKLKGSISDGDIRRFVLQNGDISMGVRSLVNCNPFYFFENQAKEEIKNFFASCDMWSVPIINYNNEVIAVVFRNGQVVNNRNLAECPVVIMAGGKGTRLYPYTKILPKALIPIGDTPVTERIINKFQSYGCNSFYMIVNYKKDMIRAYFEGNAKKYNINFYNEDIPLGTGGGLYMLKGKIQGDFFFTNCDILIDADYTSMYYKHKKEKNAITVIASEYVNCISYGVIKIDESCNYMGMDEKPSKKYYINTGLYIINSQVLELIPDNIEISFPDIITKAEEKGFKIGVYVVNEEAYMDMGQLEELDKMQRKLDL